MEINQFTPETDILHELAKRLARIRKAQGFSQVRLAEEAGIGVATLRRIEAGHDSQLDTWLKLLKALNMTPSINHLLPETFNSPMAEARAGKSRKRKKSTPSPSPGITWGDEAQ